MILHAKQPPEHSLAGELCFDMKTASSAGKEGSCGSLTSSPLFVLVLNFFVLVIIANHYHCPMLSRPQYCRFLLPRALAARVARHEFLSLLAFLVSFLVP